MIEQIQHLLAILPQHKIETATRDLHFDLTQLDKLHRGQLAVLHRRLSKVNFKTLQEHDDTAEQSELIQSMRQSLNNFTINLKRSPEDEFGSENIAGDDCH